MENICEHCYFQGMDCHVERAESCDRFEHVDSHIFSSFAANHERMTRIVEFMSSGRDPD